MADETIEPKTPDPVNPYGDFRFCLKWDDKYIAGFSKISDLDRDITVLSFRSGGDPVAGQLARGQDSYAAIVLERGMTVDPAFEQWCNMVWDNRNHGSDDAAGSGEDVSPQDFRMNITVEFYNEAGQMVLAYLLLKCWPSEFVAVPELDGKNYATAIQTLKLENEGWERKDS